MKVRDVMQRNVVTVAEDETLELVLQVLLWNEVRHVPVLRPADGRVSGVIGERDLLRAQRSHPAPDVFRRQAREFMSSPAQHIHPDADLADAAADFATKDIGCMPVIEVGELMGIITARDVAAALAKCEVPERSNAGGAAESVESVMSPTAFVVRGDEPLMLAAGRMLRGHIRHLCVVDRDGKLEGILSDRDVRSAVGDPRRVLQAPLLPPRLTKLTVKDVMTVRPRALRAGDPLHLAIETLASHRYGALPVTDSTQRPVGVISYVDVLRHIAGRGGASDTI